jgi:hypothetical protein
MRYASNSTQQNLVSQQYVELKCKIKKKKH